MQVQNLEDILKKAQHLNVHLDNSISSTLPKLNKNIYQLLEESQNILNKHKGGVQESDLFKASLLLGDKDIAVPDAVDHSKLKKVDDLEIYAYTDIDVNDKCDQFCEDVLHDIWAHEKRDLAFELGSFAPSMTGILQNPKILADSRTLRNVSVMSQTPLSSRLHNKSQTITFPFVVKTEFNPNVEVNQSFADSIQPSSKATCLSVLESAQAQQLITYNYSLNLNATSIVENINFDSINTQHSSLHLLHAFTQCAKLYSDNKDCIMTWEMLSNIVRKPNTLTDGLNATFGDSFSKAILEYRSSSEYQCEHIYYTKTYLQTQFFQHVQKYVENNNQQQSNINNQFGNVNGTYMVDPKLTNNAFFGSVVPTSKLAHKTIEFSDSIIANAYLNIRAYVWHLANKRGVYNPTMLDEKPRLNDRGMAYSSSEDNKLTLDSVPIWMFLYHALRAGQFNIALHYVNLVKHIIGPNFTQCLNDLVTAHESVENFTNYLCGNQNSSISTTSAPTFGEKRNILQTEYRKTVRHTNDSFKKACYAIVAQLNLPHETFDDITNTTDDFLWFKISICYPDNIVTGHSDESYDTLSNKKPTGFGGYVSNLSQRGTGAMSSSIGAKSFLTFGELQTMIVQQFGPEYFRAKEKPWLYIRILLALNLFELACQFMASTVITSNTSKSMKIKPDPDHNISAMASQTNPLLLLSQSVNMACALHSAKLIQLTKRVDDDLITENKASLGQSFNLNLQRLILLYTRGFELHDIEEAISYYFCLRDIPDSTKLLSADNSPMKDDLHENACEKSIQNVDSSKTVLVPNLYVRNVVALIQKTKNFEDILGKIDMNDGIKTKQGIVDRLGIFTNEIANSAARQFEEKAQYPLALHIYLIAKNYDRLFTLLKQLLYGYLLNSSNNANFEADTNDITGLISLADNVAKIYTISKSSVSLNSGNLKEKSQTFFLLLDICKFFNAIQNGNASLAISIIEALRLVPINKSEVENCIQNFGFAKEEIRNLYPNILLRTMQLYQKEFIALKRELENAEDTSISKLPTQSFLLNGTLSSTLMQKTTQSKNILLEEMQKLRFRADALIMFAGLLPYRLPININMKLHDLAAMIKN